MYNRANETKPRINNSKIVDLNKRNFESQLTVTIPHNDVIRGNVSADNIQNPTYYDDIKMESVIGRLAESEIMNHFKRCFDQFKIVDSHLCIDVREAPSFIYTVSKMKVHPRDVEFSTNGVNWIKFREEGDIVPEILTQEEYNKIKAVFPISEGDYAHTTGEEEDINVEVPFIIAAASKRSIPNGFFQYSDYNETRVNWNDLMGYGSCIWESKLPGASVHLSLDIAASSNSERMMTFPSQMLNKLHMLTPALQNGRFCPIVLHGIRIKKLDDNEVAGSITTTVAHRNNDSFYHDLTEAQLNTFRLPFSNGLQQASITIGSALATCPFLLK